MLSIAGIVGVFTLTGMNTAIVQAVARGFDGALKIGALIKLRWSIGVTLAASVVALYYFINDNNMLAISFLIVGTFAPFLESFKLYNSFLIGKREFRASAMLGMWRKRSRNLRCSARLTVCRGRYCIKKDIYFPIQIS